MVRFPRALRLPLLVLGYLALASVLLWPAVADLGQRVPGGPRTDLWNSLWSVWYFTGSLADGVWPGHTDLLDHPDGGTLWVSDPLGALMAAPFVPLLGLAGAYTVLVLLQLGLAGAFAHCLAAELWTWRREGEAGAELAGLVAGVGYATAPVLLSGVHNGTSEAFAGGWAAWAAWAAFRTARHGGWPRALEAGLALGLAALASWYSAVVAFLFAGAVLLLGIERPWRRHLLARAAALGLGLALVLPLAAAVQDAATAEDNLVGIKNERELRSVRRSTGPADPVGYLAPGDYRSPDFRELSRYGEGFFHCHYLGYTLLLGALLALRRPRGLGWLVAAGLAGLALSLGPVLARFGQAVIVMGDRAIPLPYLLLEGLPGFGSLSLLYRLAAAPALAAAVLAGLGWGGLVGEGRRRVLAPIVAALILAEGLLLSPLGARPDTTDVSVAPGVLALAEAPDGAVMNYPLVGGRGYLYEQTVHGKPVAGTLNFPNNLASKKVWKSMLDAVDDDAADFRRAVGKAARKQGIRYLVVHLDPLARPDMHDAAVRAVKDAYDPIGGSEGIGAGEAASETAVRVYKLW